VQTTLQGVDANHITRDSYPSLENLTLNITTEFPDVWYKYFQEQLDKNVSSMSPRVGLNGDYRITKLTNMVSIEFWNVNALNIDIAIIAISMS